MRKLLLGIALALVAGAWCGVQAAESAKGIVFAETEHDFGQIDERGKPVSHVFEFTNESDKPLVITKVHTSCKCTSYDYPRKPVAPGAKGSVKITFAPRKQAGHIYRVIRIETSQGRAMLTIKGEVK